MSEPVKLYIELTSAEAYWLAQFIKRSTFNQYRAMDGEETFTMIAAVEKVGAALEDAGYKPR